MQRIPYGYKWDENKNKLIINENEAKVIRIISDMFTEYKLNQNEITDLISREETIYDIIDIRIERLYSEIANYYENIINPFVNIDVAERLEQENEKSEFAEILKNLKNEILQKNLDDEEKNISTDIDDIITLILKKDEINEMIKQINTEEFNNEEEL